jgi:predicted O-linked N-acetylglucosamine transferase (SPINDLY family)
MSVVSPDAFAEARNLLVGGRPGAALAAFRALVDSHPHAPNLRYWLGSALAANGDDAAAADAWSTARIFHSLALMRDMGVDMPRLAVDADYAAEVGAQLMEQGLPGVAASALAKASESGLGPEALTGYGLAMGGLGMIGEAFEALQSADMLAPTAVSHARMIGLHTFVRDLAVGRVREARAWAERYAPALPPASPAFDRTRPLRVGYLAANFSSDSLQRYAVPAIAHHDLSLVYPILYLADGRGAPRDEQIRPLDGLDDRAAAEAIRADGLDILVDMAGHGPGGRLGVFALKPAPIQICWARDPYTTGLSAMDYVLQAEAVGGYDIADLFAEQPWTIGPVAAPYRAAPAAPTPTPALTRGQVSFGFFGPPAWLADSTIALWARILKAQPDSRLILKHGLYDDPVVQRQTAARFAAQGVAVERLDFRGQTTGEFHDAEFADVDLGLLPSACVEPTPLLEMLAHGVPVLAVRGPDFQSRCASYPLKACGLETLVQETGDSLVGCALRLTDDLAELAALRATVLPAFEASAFGDPAAFARRLEAAYDVMIETRIERTTTAAA